MTKITKKKFKLALENSGGNQSIISQKLEVARGSVTRFLQKNQDMKELCETESERIIDVAENILDSAITTGRDIDSAKWKLTNSKRGKSRGYGPKTEMEHSGSAPVNIQLIERSIEEIKDAKIRNKPEAKGNAESP